MGQGALNVALARRAVASAKWSEGGVVRGWHSHVKSPF